MNQPGREPAASVFVFQPAGRSNCLTPTPANLPAREAAILSEPDLVDAESAELLDLLNDLMLCWRFRSSYLPWRRSMLHDLHRRMLVLRDAGPLIRFMADEVRVAPGPLL